MELNCKLLEKTFKDADGQSHVYYVLSFPLADGSSLELPIKGDKVKLLKLSNTINFPQIDKDIWEEK